MEEAISRSTQKSSLVTYRQARKYKQLLHMCTRRHMFRRGEETQKHLEVPKMRGQLHKLYSHSGILQSTEKEPGTMYINTHNLKEKKTG